MTETGKLAAIWEFRPGVLFPIGAQRWVVTVSHGPDIDSIAFYYNPASVEPALLYLLPSAVGEAWGESACRTPAMQVVAKWTICSPAGCFDDATLFKHDDCFVEGAMQIGMWLTPDVGIVRIEAKLVDVYEGTVTETWQLLSYELASGSGGN